MKFRSYLPVILLTLSTPLFAQTVEQRLAPFYSDKGKAAEESRLKKLLDEHWAYSMKESPESATYAGYPGLNDKWTDNSISAIDRRKAELLLWNKAVEDLDRAGLPATEQLNYDLFRKNLLLAVEGMKFPSEYLQLTQLGGVQQDIVQTIGLMPTATIKDYENIVTRLRNSPPLVDQTIELLRKGVSQRVTPPKITLRDVAQQIRNQLVYDINANPAYRPFLSMPAAFGPEETQRLRNAAANAINTALLPALEKFLKFFENDYYPRTRQLIAASDLPNGREWYAYRARVSTTTDLTPQQIHSIGQAEVKRIRAEMEKVMKQADFHGTRAEFIKFLREDSQFFYTKPEDLLTGYRDISKRADAELPKLFGKLPRLPYGVAPIPSYAEKSQTTAYYQPGANSFGRPGIFYANTYNLKTRPKWEMEALTLHEAMPGHHLQIALAQELENVPEFRKHEGYTAFVEGWGLYSESLGEEMGFYKDPYSKYGQLTYEMWRAVRLVVDTGMHSLGWSREQAINFFKENAPKTEHDITVEIDRYIVWPGQALAYKIGELKIKELRKRAQDKLAGKFNIREFHDELLGQGAVPLDILEQRMNAWIERRSSAP